MRRNIPAKTEVVCDICQQVCSGLNYKKASILQVERNGLDYLGDPACKGDYTIDLCDKCDSLVEDAINALKEEAVR